MGNLINRKWEKTSHIFDIYGLSIDESEFADIYKKTYPNDWQVILKQYAEEESSTPVGKKHPMPHPDIYMKNMYRNFIKRYMKEKKVPNHNVVNVLYTNSNS